jgi:hypothetical protein
MIRKLVHISGAVVTAMLLFANTGSAQTIDGAGGYAFRHEENESIKKGWFGAIGGNFNDAFGAFFQVSQHSKTFDNLAVPVDVTLSVIGGGPRLTGNQRAGVTYFVNALFGTAKLKTKAAGNSVSLPGRFAFQPAVGVDVKAGGTVGVRFEFAPTYIKPEGDETAWAYHFMVGVVVRGG